MSAKYIALSVNPTLQGEHAEEFVKTLRELCNGWQVVMTLEQIQEGLRKGFRVFPVEFFVNGELIFTVEVTR